MKRILCLILSAVLTLVLACSAFGLAAFADQTDPRFDERLINEVCAGIREEKQVIDVSAYSLKVSDFPRFSEYVKYNNPEFFYLDQFRYSYSGDYVRTLLPQYTLTGSELASAKARFEENTEALFALADEDADVLETVLFYHEYLALNYEYDSSLSIYDAYNLTEEKKGVCQAYTMLFLLIMRHFGIPCSYVTSDSLEHMWNIVYVDGAWYHLDVTHDDPVPDRKGQVCHRCFLTGSVTTAQLKNVSDMVFGENVTVSPGDHPICSAVRDSIAPIREIGDKWYGILRFTPHLTALCQILPSSGETAILVRFPFDIGDDSFLEWEVTGSGGSYYTANYSGLCTDGRYLYFNDAKNVYSYDPSTGRPPRLIGDCDESVSIYGLTLTAGILYICTGTSPEDRQFTGVIIQTDIPVYYSITWVIGEISILTFAEEGSDPEESFFGSTYKEDDRGVRYTFAGWTPEVVPAVEDAVYTALYTTEKLYVDGDADGNGIADINDVSALLDCLSTGGSPVSFWAADLDGSDDLGVNDVTLLLNLLAGVTPEDPPFDPDEPFYT